MILSAATPYRAASRPIDVDGASAVALLRAARLDERAGMISSSVYQFNSEVEEYLRGSVDIDALTVKAAAAFREFKDTSDAAVRAGALESRAAETVQAVLHQIQQEFAEGVAGVHSALGIVADRDQSASDFVVSARLKLSKIQEFWDKNVLGADRSRATEN